MTTVTQDSTREVEVEKLCVAGLEVVVYRPAAATTENQPTTGEDGVNVAVVYLLHGRGGSRVRVDGFARRLVASCVDKDKGYRKVGRRLWVVTFDHRNHGTRMVDEFANEGWNLDGEKHNAKHAVDMYSIQLGTAKDISLLTDLLPSYLFPEGEKQGKVEGWGAVGISLGGHSVWLAMCHDERIRVGVPIIGCPDYLGLMEHRAEQNRLRVEPPHFPASLRELVLREDPVHRDYTAQEKNNPFVGKKVLVLCGADDELVPWSQSSEFVNGLEVGEDGIKEVEVYEGDGHECTKSMEGRTAEFIYRELLI